MVVLAVSFKVTTSLYYDLCRFVFGFLAVAMRTSCRVPWNGHVLYICVCLTLLVCVSGVLVLVSLSPQATYHFLSSVGW